MIIEALILSISAVITVVLDLFPKVDATTASSITTFYTNFKNTTASIGWIFPLDTAFQVLGIVITVELSILTFRSVRWIIGLISGGFVRA